MTIDEQRGRDEVPEMRKVQPKGNRGRGKLRRLWVHSDTRAGGQIQALSSSARGSKEKKLSRTPAPPRLASRNLEDKH